MARGSGNGSRRWRIAASIAAVIVLSLVVSAVPAPPVPSVSGGTATSLSAAAPAAAPPGAAGAHVSAVPGPRGFAPVNCPIGYPSVTGLPGGILPLDPNFNLQTPCAPYSVDEIHASFSSSVVGSAERWTVPMTLPSSSGSSPTGANIAYGFYVGEVVSGDRASAYNQSYLEVIATPAPQPLGPTIWNVSVAVLSLVNSSIYGASGCPGSSQNLSWNNSYFCEIDDLSSGKPLFLGGFTGGTPLNVTLAGTVGGRSGIAVWLNDSLSGASDSTVLNATTTGTHTFEPAYASACADSCELDWGLSYGLGIGLSVCPAVSGPTSCNTYDGTTWSELPPFAVGVPLFYQAGAYRGQYYYLSPSSASGMCNTAPPTGATVAPCNDEFTNGGDGSYPYFSLNGTGLNLGLSYPYTVSTLGGAGAQYSLTSGARDLIPMVPVRLSDSSDAGYVAPGGSVTVSGQWAAFGSVTGVAVNYSVDGGGFLSLTSSLVSGSPTDGVWNATIPSGPNGTIVYYANGTDAAGATVSRGPFVLHRGPLPRFDLTLVEAPPTCGAIVWNGSAEANGTTVTTLPGTFPIAATGCPNYAFNGWTVAASSSVTVGSPSASRTTVRVAGNATLTASWTYVRPVVTVTVLITPSACGYVSIGSTSYTNGSVVPLGYGLTYSLGETPSCTLTGNFAGWLIPEGNLSIVGSSLIPYANSTLVARYVGASGTDRLTFQTAPSSCGGVGFGQAAYANGVSLSVPSGTYPIYGAPCPNYGLLRFNATGGVVLNGNGTVSISGSGTLTEVNYRLTEITVVTSPGSCGGVTIAGGFYRNGAVYVAQNDSTYTVNASSCPGHFLNSLTASGGLTLVGSLLFVNGSGTLLAVSLPGTPSVFVGILTNPPGCGGVRFEGETYTDGAFLTLPPATSGTLTPVPCATYGFQGWYSTGGIGIAGNQVWFNGSGALVVTFAPLVTVLIATQPTTCGGIAIGSTSYTNGGAVTLVAGVSYPLEAEPCAHYGLVAFESSPYVALNGTTLTPTGPSTLTAVFAPLTYRIEVDSGGTGCGSIHVAGISLSSGAVALTAGTYGIGAVPCPGSFFAGWNVTGNVTVLSRAIDVEGNGSVLATFDLQPPLASLTGPSAGLVGEVLEFAATVPDPIAGSGYVYVWFFGDGTTNTTATNTTVHAYASPGRYTVTVEVIDPDHRSVNATWTLDVSAVSVASVLPLITGGLLATGVALAAIAAVLVVTRRPGRPPVRTGAPDPPSSPSRRS
ncbi:MAG: PKD domain-containing protein [Thermoplasmata archaeon]